MTYLPEFVALTQRLRQQIVSVRTPPPAAAA